MTELLTKQLWQGVQTVGDPDFINRQIVAYGTPAPPQAEAPSPELVQAATAAVGSDTDEVTGPVEGSFASSSGPSGPESSNARAEPAKRLSRPSRPPSVPPTLPKRPPPKASSIDAEIPSSGPFDAIGGLATAAVGSVASAATKTVEVLGAAAEETGKALAGDNTDERGFANANSSDVSRTSSASGSAQTAVKRKPPPSVGPPVMHMDIPPSAGVDVPLPESLRPRQSKQADEDVTGYSIREPDAADGANSVGPSSRGPSSTRASPAPEPRDSAGPRGQNRSSSTVQPANAPSGSSRPPLAFVLSRKDPSLYDAFENYCERFSTQGETLLRLHTQLDTLAAISRMTEQDPEMFRQDAQVILVKACEGLAQGPSGHASTDEDETLRRERTASVLRNTLERLGHRADLSVLQPAVDEVHERLESLFEAFWIRTHQSRTEERMRVEQPTSVPGMSYEPRRKPSAPTQTSRPVPPVPTAAIDSSAQAHQTIASAARASQPDATIADQPTSSVRQSLDANNGAVLSIGRQSGGSDQLEVSVTDVSPNAEVSGPVDPRTLELMVAVEGLAAAGGGFVLMRTFAEFERLDADLRRALPGPRRVPLPSARGKTSATICRDVERYIVAVLSDALHVSSAPVQAFFDKTKAGAPVAAIRMRMAGLGPNALFSGLQKSIASGVGAVGKGAKSLQLPARSSSPFSAGQEPLNRSPTRATAAGDVDGYLSRSREQGRSSQRNSWSETSQPASQSQPQQQPQMTTGSGPQSGSASANSSDRSSREKQVPSPPVEAELSAKDLNDMLAAIFAVADEALNLTGGWSLRRGMLRVLEQIVRTQYSGTIISTFNHAAHSLNSESIADWIEAGKEGVWPGGEWSTAPSASANRTTEEVQETARKAKEIVLSYAPTQAGYVLGPGGGQACCAALEAVHAALVDPVTATDLATELTLRALRMATA